MCISGRCMSGFTFLVFQCLQTATSSVWLFLCLSLHHCCICSHSIFPRLLHYKYIFVASYQHSPSCISVFTSMSIVLQVHPRDLLSAFSFWYLCFVFISMSIVLLVNPHDSLTVLPQLHLCMLVAHSSPLTGTCTHTSSVSPYPMLHTLQAHFCCSHLLDMCCVSLQQGRAIRGTPRRHACAAVAR